MKGKFKEIKKKDFRGTKVRDLDHQLILELVSNNFNTKEIAEHFKKNISTIYRVLWKYGVKRKSVKEFIKERSKTTQVK